jgi:regulator of sirC expression with transglutaminase-like and TPR domain
MRLERRGHLRAAARPSQLHSEAAQSPALKSYEECLRLQPDLGDAHQDAALLYARAGQKQLAIRHFSAYRRLQPRT